MNSKLPGEVIQGVEAVAGVETLLVLAVAALHFAIVAGRVGTDELVADTQLGGGGLKQRGQFRLAAGETIGKFNAVICLDTFHTDTSAGIPTEQLFQKIG